MLALPTEKDLETHFEIVDMRACVAVSDSLVKDIAETLEIHLRNKIKENASGDV